jgi:hypothetical protein
VSDHQTVPDHGSDPRPDGDDPTPFDPTDVSIKNTPAAWLEAEQQSPQDANWGDKRFRTNPSVQPARPRVNSFSLFGSGVLATILAGSAWAAAELLGLFDTPWLAVPAGILIALIIRAGCGSKDPDGRSTVAAISYLLTLLIVLGFLTRREIYEIYGDTNDVALLEENLFRRRFSRIDQLAAYAIGWAATWYTSMFLRS